MANRSKIRDSVISTLNDLSNDLNILAEKNEDKPIVKDKAKIIQRKLEIIVSAVATSKVATRQLPELLELCEIFVLNPDGSFKDCDADDVVDLMKIVSCKVAYAFESVCFEEWNLLPESRGGVEPSTPVITEQRPGSLMQAEINKRNDLDKNCDVLSVVSSSHSDTAQSETPLPPTETAKPQQPAPARIPKKPLVVFNPSRAPPPKPPVKEEIKEIKEDAVKSPTQQSTVDASRSIENIPPRLAAARSGSFTGIPATNPVPHMNSNVSGSAQTAPVFSFSVPPPQTTVPLSFHGPVASQSNHALPVNNVLQKVLADSVSHDLIQRALHATSNPPRVAPMPASTFQQVPMPILPQSTFVIPPLFHSNVAPPMTSAAQTFSNVAFAPEFVPSAQQSMFSLGSSAGVPFEPKVKGLDQSNPSSLEDSHGTSKSASKKKITIVDPRTGQEVDFSPKTLAKMTTDNSGQMLDVNTNNVGGFGSPFSTPSDQQLFYDCEGSEMGYEDFTMPEAPIIVNPVDEPSVSEMTDNLAGVKIEEAAQTSVKPEPVMSKKEPPGFSKPTKSKPPGFEPQRERSVSSMSVPAEEEQFAPRSQSVAGDASLKKAPKPPGFENVSGKARSESLSDDVVEPVKTMTSAVIESNADWIVEQVAECLRSKSSSARTGKPCKTAKVFAAFQKAVGESAGDVNISDFMEILKARSDIFRVSTHGSQIELVETIEMKIVQLIVAELTKLPLANTHGVQASTVFDAYVSRVLHVGSKLTFDEFVAVAASSTDVIKQIGSYWSLNPTFLDSIYDNATKLIAESTDSSAAEMFARFESVVSDRIAFFVPFNTFIELLTRRTDLFHFANSRVTLTANRPDPSSASSVPSSSPAPSVNQKKQKQSKPSQFRGGMGDVDDYDDVTVTGQSGGSFQTSGIVDLDRSITAVLPEEGNATETLEFVEEFNNGSSLVSDSDIIPVRSLPMPKPYNGDPTIVEFQGTVSCVSMETRRVFISFPLEPVCFCFSTARDMTKDEDFVQYAQLTIHHSDKTSNPRPAGWCNIGKTVLFYVAESDAYARGVVLGTLIVPRCDIDINAQVVESLTILDIDSGEVHEKIPARDAAALTKFRDIPCLVLRCSFVLEPGALPPKRRSTIRFMLDMRCLFPAASSAKPAKVAAARAGRIRDYKSGISPLPIVVLAPTA